MGFLSNIIVTIAFASQALAVKIRADYDGGKFLSYIPFDDGKSFCSLNSRHGERNTTSDLKESFIIDQHLN